MVLVATCRERFSQDLQPDLYQRHRQYRHMNNSKFLPSPEQVNNDVEILVNSTESMQYVGYQVLGRGDVIVASTVQIPNAGQRTAVIRFLATYAMAPTAHVIVQYIRDGGEVIADAVDVELDGVLQNYVSGNNRVSQQGVFFFFK